MSLEALRIAFANPVESSTERLVLLAYANHCPRDELTAWPSRKRLREMTALDLKTISATVMRLVSKKFLVDTGKRKGATGRVRVYRLCQPNESESGTIKSIQKRNHYCAGIDPLLPVNASENGSLNRPKNGTRNQVLNQVRIRENAARSPIGGTALPLDWKPAPEAEAWARQQRPDLDLERTTAKFVAHAGAEGWTKVDWNAAFRKWVLNERREPNSTSTVHALNCAAHSVSRANQVIAENRAAALTAEREIPESLRKYIT